MTQIREIFQNLKMPPRSHEAPVGGGLTRRRFLLLSAAATAASVLPACDSQASYKPKNFGEILEDNRDYRPVIVTPEVFAMLPPPYETLSFVLPDSSISMSEGTVQPDIRQWNPRTNEYDKLETPKNRVLIFGSQYLVGDVVESVKNLSREINAVFGLPVSYTDSYGAYWFKLLEEDWPEGQVLKALQKSGYEDNGYGIASDSIYIETDRPRPDQLDKHVIYSARFEPALTVQEHNYSTYVQYSPSADTTSTGLGLTFYKGLADIGQINVVYPYNLEDIVRSVRDGTSPTEYTSSRLQTDSPLPIDQICNFRIPLSEMPPAMLDAANSTLARALEDFQTLYPGHEPEFVVNLKEYILETGKEVTSTRTITYSELTQSSTVTEHSGHGMGINLGLIFDLALSGTSNSSGSSSTSGSIHDSGQTTDSTTVIHTGLDIQGYVRLVPTQ